LDCEFSFETFGEALYPFDPDLAAIRRLVEDDLPDRLDEWVDFAGRPGDHLHSPRTPVAWVHPHRKLGLIPLRPYLWAVRSAAPTGFPPGGVTVRWVPAHHNPPMRSGLSHNDAVTFFTYCPCDCHRGGRQVCWCAGSAPVPFNISHNDRIEMFGHCGCVCHRSDRVSCRCRPTDPELAHLADRRRERRYERDLEHGRPWAINQAVRRGDPRVWRMLHRD